MAKPDSHDAITRDPQPAFKLDLPWLILAALLLSTLLAAFQSSRQIRADAQLRFTEIAQVEKRVLASHLNEILQVLHGASAVATAVPTLNQATWERYVAARLRERGTRPPIVALLLIPNVNAPNIPNTLSSVLAPRISLEEVAALAKSPQVAEAILRASVTAAPALSVRFDATSTPQKSADWVALALPLLIGDNLDNRLPTHPHSIGTALAILDLGTVVKSMTEEPAYPVAHALSYEGRRFSTGVEEAVTSTDLVETSQDVPVDFGQRRLMLKISSTPQLEKTLQSDLPRIILMIGIFGTILLGALVLLLTRLRQQAEALASTMTRKLQDQTRFTEDLIEFNPNPIFRKDASGHFVAVNQAWEQLTGHRRQDVLGHTSEGIQTADEYHRSQQQDAGLATSTVDNAAFEVVVTHLDGRQFETIVAKKVLRRANGSVDGIIGTITDVTQTKQLEHELARQREQLDLVIRSSQQGIWDIPLTRDGAAYYSARFREILGYTEATFPVRFDWVKNTHPDEFAASRQLVVAHFKMQTPLIDIELRIKRVDGSYMWVRVRGVAQRDAHGRADRFVGSIVDVTDRKLAEVELTEANARVTEAARAKDAFLATMSHEIRTPLNGVLGMASLLSDTALNDEQRDYIRLIRASGDTLLRLIDDVLDFSKIESGRMTMESVSIEVVTLVEETFDLVAEKAREKDLALLFEVADDVPFYIQGDPTRLRQILLNLLTNAIKFTDKGEVTLELRSRLRADGQLELEGRVADTGIGIPQQRASELFQPFTQVDASTTRKYGGTGLGLVIVRRLAQIMGGDVRVESQEGLGSTFIFTILTAVARGPQKPYMRVAVADFVGKRLLLVDRNENRQAIEKRCYARWGFDTVATTPEHAVDVLNQEASFDIVFTQLETRTSEVSAMREALDNANKSRQLEGDPPTSVILHSTCSRTDLSTRQLTPALRHEAFLLHPLGRSRVFDVLMRAILQQPNHDVATRPYQHLATAAALDTTDRHETPGGAITTEPPPSRVVPVVAERRDARTTVSSPATPRILVAEDNEVNQHVILGMLKNLGHHADLARDGGEAVRMAVAGAYDIILMDIHMPELDGVTAMQNIRTLLAPDAAPPIVAMTAHALPGDRERYLAIGMNDYVSKPIRPNDLRNLFARLFAAATVNHPPAVQSPPVPAPMTNPSPQLKPVASPLSDDLPILDTEQLEDLRYLPAGPSGADGTANPVGSLIQLFRDKATERIDAMERLLAEGEWKELSEIAHSLRGSAASVGFPRVAAACKTLELAARDKTPGDLSSVHTQEHLDDHFAMIQFHYRVADDALSKWLKNNTAAPK